MQHGGVDHLLHPVDVRGEARHDDAALGAQEHAVEHRHDVALGGDEARNLGVGRVDEQQVDPLVAESGERVEVGDAPVERHLVHLEVTGVQHASGRGGDGHCEGVGDRVVHGHELDLERAARDDLLLLDLHGLRHDAVLAQLGLQQGEGEPGAHDRDVGALAQQVGHRPDVVLVRVGEDDRLDVVEAVAHVLEVGEDQVDPGLVVLGEQHPAVDDEQPACELEDGHVAADLTEAAQRDDAQAPLGKNRWRA